MGFLETLLSVFVKVSSESSLVQQLVYLLTLAVGNSRFSGLMNPDKYDFNDIQRSRTYSNSSVGSTSGRPHMKKMKKESSHLSLPQVNGKTTADLAETDATRPVNTFSFAWSVFNHLIKYSPIASAWLISKEEKYSDENLLKLDDSGLSEMHSLLLTLSLSSSEIEAEKSRLLSFFSQLHNG
jgi:hypothetical protein